MIKEISVGCLIVLLTFGLITFLERGSSKEVSKKDCMIADISPDYTAKDRELCRELRGKK
jgi:hypothetical protein